MRLGCRLVARSVRGNGPGNLPVLQECDGHEARGRVTHCLGDVQTPGGAEAIRGHGARPEHTSVLAPGHPEVPQRGVQEAPPEAEGLVLVAPDLGQPKAAVVRVLHMRYAESSVAAARGRRRGPGRRGLRGSRVVVREGAWRPQVPEDPEALQLRRQLRQRECRGLLLAGQGRPELPGAELPRRDVRCGARSHRLRRALAVRVLGVARQSQAVRGHEALLQGPEERALTVKHRHAVVLLPDHVCNQRDQP
mmetsp:Transcript_73305/g.231513  ORF Transcript_73305/g.231513 Transcript_73305/m.231513 type:complete len:250 (+) Transcript_73305:1429-2178(+)